MGRNGLLRREFLYTTAAVGALAATGIVSGPQRAWALSTTSLDPHTAQTLLAVAYELFPHERLGMQYYAVVVEELDKEVVKDPALRKQLVDGVARLDAVHAVPFTDLSEGARIAALKSIETTDFFATMRAKTISGLYGNPRVYILFGYEGSSVEYGGYINRGFNDIGWLQND